ncbi:hypothetical protein ACVXHB_01855 [Escherichia coli]
MLVVIKAVFVILCGAAEKTNGSASAISASSRRTSLVVALAK